MSSAKLLDRLHVRIPFLSLVAPGSGARARMRYLYESRRHEPPKEEGARLHPINVPLVVVLAWITLQWTGCSQRGPFPEESLDDPAAIPSQEAIAASRPGRPCR